MEDTRSLKQRAWDYQLQLDARAAWLEGQEIQKRKELHSKERRGEGEGTQTKIIELT